MDLSRQQMGRVLYYECHNNLGTAEYQKKMYESLGINIVSYDTVKDQFRISKAGNFDNEVEARSRRPNKVDCEQLKQIIDQDINISTRTTALQLEICVKNC